MVDKILVLASNPQGTERIRIDKEIRQIKRILRNVSQRGGWLLESELAVRKNELQSIIVREKPRIVHFCGHGMAQELVLENEQGEPDYISTKALVNLLKSYSQRIECVVLNVCYSEELAEAINQNINYVIGTKKEIQDEAAIAFSKGFYGALGEQESIECAFDLGCNQIQIEIYKDNKGGRKFVPVYSEEEQKIINIPQHEVLKILVKDSLNQIESENPSDSLQRCGKPFQAPPLPSHFVERPEVSQDLKKRLIEDSINHSGTLVISEIHGLGGIGKTILAQALAHDPQVQEYFCDGILWATLGQQPDILSLLQAWIIELKDYDYKPTTVQAASAHLNSLLHDQAVLLVIDDGWNVEDIEPFRVGGGKCQVIITTRRADVAEKVYAQLYSLDLMSEEQSLMLLAKRLRRSLQEEEKESAKQLAAAVGYLPLALDLAAVRISRDKDWAELCSALTKEIAELEVLQGAGDRNKNIIEASFNLSLKVLKKDFPLAWVSFFWLGVLPEDISIAPPMVATLWQVEVTEAKKRLEILCNDAFLLPGVPVKIDDTQWKSYRLHDLLHDLSSRGLTTKLKSNNIAEAHQILLGLYKKNISDRLWHKLTDDGYIHDHLTWHMEKAGCVDSIHQLLREETDSGKNGWHSKCESLGKTAIFVGDVARAWKLAEEQYKSNPTIVIGLQCRYALIISSLNTIAGNIHPKLIAVLVEKNIWNLAQGLAYSRQMQSLSQRAEALSGLVPYLPEIYSEALKVLSNIKNESKRAEILSSLALHLPQDLLSEVLAEARNIKNESERERVLSALALHLPQDLLSEVLVEARNIKNESERAEILSALASHLSQDLLSEALAEARKIREPYERAKVLSSLAPYLPQDLLSEVLAEARNIGNQPGRARILSSLAPHLPSICSEALAEARNIRNQYERAKVLSSLAPHLPQDLLSEVLAEARNIKNESERAEILSALAPYLPQDLLSEALQSAKTIPTKYSEDKAKVLSSNVTKITAIA